jgi:hypothetical protein
MTFIFYRLTATINNLGTTIHLVSLANASTPKACLNRNLKTHFTREIRVEKIQCTLIVSAEAERRRLRDGTETECPGGLESSPFSSVPSVLSLSHLTCSVSPVLSLENYY